MPEEYTNFVEDLKGIGFPVAEYGWNTRPNADSYGIVAPDFEVDALHGDNVKQITAWEGSLDFYSKDKRGAGWIGVITGLLTEHFDGAWQLNHHTYEQETGLFHWEWTFQFEE